MAEYVVELKNITKRFPGVVAMKSMCIGIRPGEIHGLIGENGAGKSTLMNVLSGIYPYGSYTGDIVYEGEVCKFAKITESEEKGIVIIHQELALVPEMTIGENMYLGNERGHKFAIDWNTTYADADKYLKMVWGDPDKVDEVEQQTNGQGEAEIVESDSDNGENETGGSV